jgi:outer membrane protein assembly factor BamB
MQQALILLAALAALPACAGDWPQLFLDNSRNAVCNVRNLPATFVPGTTHLDDTNSPGPEVSNLKWRVKLKSHAYSGPVLADGRIFVGTNDGRKGGRLTALDPADGKILWQFDVPRFVTKLPQYNYDDLDLGLCSTPTIKDGWLFLVSNRDEVFCVDAAGRRDESDPRWTNEAWEVEGSTQPPPFFSTDAGGLRWSFRMLTEKHVEAWVQDASSCSVIVDGDYVYVNPSNGVDKSHKNVPRPDAPSLIVLDKNTGRLIARDREHIGRRLFHGEWSSPALGVVNGRKLIFWGAGDGVCYAFEAEPVPPAAGEDLGTLKLVWRFDINRAGGRAGEYKTEAGPSEVIATPVFHSNRIYLAVGQDPRHKEGRGVLACIDATGSGDITESGKVWVNTDIDRSLTSVAVADGLLFTADFSGRIFCLDAGTGRTRWMHETHHPIWSSPLLTADKVYVGTDTGDLWAFKRSGDLDILGKVKLDSPISASPIAVDGVLYVLTQRYLYAVASGANVRD